VSSPPTLDSVLNLRTGFDNVEDMRTFEHANDVMTVPASLAGIPALVLPLVPDETSDIKLPLGIQIMAQYGNDNFLFEVGKALLGDL
jgi:aspartyl-tRNA(Asn)/glutamyl-tRNA(Gln) amidotransferase subunit A